jgi:hypothetical protein
MILEIAKSQNSIALTIETHLLNSKIHLIELDYAQVEEQLKLAEKLASKNNLPMLIKKIENDRKSAIEYLKEKYTRKISNSSLGDRIEEVAISNYLDEVSKVLRS